MFSRRFFFHQFRYYNSTRTNLVYKKNFKIDQSQLQFSVNAISYAENFNLLSILEDVKLNLKYHLTIVDDVLDMALHIKLKNENITDINIICDYFVFSDGVVVFWNIDNYEKAEFFNCIKKHSSSLYLSEISKEETETMPFIITSGNKSNLKKDVIYLHNGHALNYSNNDINNNQKKSNFFTNVLERYAFSHALATSVKVGIWENQLNQRAEPLSGIAYALTNGRIIWKRKDTLKKIGEFARLRHSINLAKLFNQDFYWERPEYERLYNSLCKYLAVSYRLNMMNKRLDYCQQLVNSIDNVLTHNHASTLEWMIIILILIEIFFDFWHFVHLHTNEDILFNKK